jgi:thiosulfate/3-mercaptopyruvate sulfurtransferase
VWDAWKPKPGPIVYPEILVTPGWLEERLDADSVTVLDARSSAAQDGGRIPGARRFAFAGEFLVPDAFGEGSFGEELGRLGLAGDETVVCVGDSGSALEVGRLFWMLEVAGHRGVRVLNGGFEAWMRAGFPVETGTPAGIPRRRFRPDPDTSRVADYAYVRTRFGRPGTALLDWRIPREWEAGHIPHSLPFPLESLVDELGRLLSGEAMRAVFKLWGPRPREYVSLSDELIVCGSVSPPRVSVHPYLAARIAGIERVRFYPRGTSDWESHADAPLVRIVEADAVRAMLRAAWDGDPPDRPPPGLMLFDLRGAREFAAGHLPGAVSLPAHRFGPDLEPTAAEVWPGADRGKTPVVLYCYGPACTRSRNCGTLAARAGYRRILWFREGTQGWKAAGGKMFKPSS